MKFWFKFILYAAVFIGFSAANADPSVSFFRSVNVDDARGVKRLLAQGFDPNTLNPHGQPALIQAIRDDSPAVVAALLEHPKLLLEATTPAGETALMMAAISGNLDYVRQLLARGAQVNRPGWTPLHYAASGPSEEVVALLLDRGAQIDAPSPNRSTPLMMAAGYGSEASAQLLLQRGADPRLRNDLELSVVDFARRAGRERLAARLEPLLR